MQSGPLSKYRQPAQAMVSNREVLDIAQLSRMLSVLDVVPLRIELADFVVSAGWIRCMRVSFLP